MLNRIYFYYNDNMSSPQIQSLEYIILLYIYVYNLKIKSAMLWKKKKIVD